MKENNPNWLYIPDHSHRMLIIVGSGSGKTNEQAKAAKLILIKFICMLNIHMNQNIIC